MAPSESVLSEPPPPSTLNEPTLGRGAPLQPETDRLVVHAESRAGLESALGRTGLTAAGIEPVPGQSNHWFVITQEADPEGLDARVGSLKAEPEVRFALPTYRRQGGEEVVPINRVAVEFHAHTTARQIDSLLEATGFSLERAPVVDSGFVAHWLHYPPEDERHPFEIAQQVDRDPLIRWAEPDRIEELRLAGSHVPTDPYYEEQYYLKSSETGVWGVPVDSNAEPAWQHATGEGIPSAGGLTVAIIDTGVEGDHPEFGSRVSQGYDLTWSTHDCQQTSADAPVNKASDAHGTHVAGIIAAAHDGDGIAGIAPDVHVMPVRILCDGNEPRAAQIADAIHVAWFTGADVLNLSWTYADSSTAIANAIADADSLGRGGDGAVVVAGTGNASDDVAFPAYLASTIAVGAINKDGLATTYANEGPELELVAPSSHTVDSAPCHGDVVTTDLLSSAGCPDGPDGDPDYTSTFGGTSASTAQVSGAAILVLDYAPSLTGAQVRARLNDRADYWGESETVGNGKLNIGAAVVNLAATISGPWLIDTAGNHQWTADASGGDSSYSYQWYYRAGTSGAWTPVGTNQTYSQWVDPEDPDFQLRVVVESMGVSVTHQRMIETDPCGDQEICE